MSILFTTLLLTEHQDHTGKYWPKTTAVPTVHIRYELGMLSMIMPLPINMYVWVIDQVWGQDGWILAKFFFLHVYRPRQSRGPQTRKKKTRPISSHLDRTNLVNKGFIIWLSGKFFLRETAGSPERARWLHLARLGSQSHRTIWVILLAPGASHVINIIVHSERITSSVKGCNP